MNRYFLTTISLLTMGSLARGQQIDTAGIARKVLSEYIYMDSPRLKMDYIKRKTAPVLDNTFATFIRDWEQTNNTKLNDSFKRNASTDYYAFRCILVIAKDSLGHAYSPSNESIEIWQRAVNSYLDQYSRKKKPYSLESILVTQLGKKDMLAQDLAAFNYKRRSGLDWRGVGDPTPVDYSAEWWQAHLNSAAAPPYTTIIIQTNVDGCTVLADQDPIGLTSGFKLSIQIPLGQEERYTVQKDGYVDFKFPPIKLDKVAIPPKRYPADLKKIDAH